MSKQITLTDYYAYLEKKGLSKSTVATYRSSINRFVAWLEQKEAHEMADGGLTALQKAFQKHIQLFKKTAGKDLKLTKNVILEASRCGGTFHYPRTSYWSLGELHQSRGPRRRGWPGVFRRVAFTGLDY